MEDLSLKQLIELGQQKHSPSLSLFLPTFRYSDDVQKNIIRFKNLVQEAEQALKDYGMKPRQIETFMKPAQELLIHTYVWRHQYDGLAVFINADDFHDIRLPFPVEKQMILAGSYYIKPILPLFFSTGHYYVLALSQNEVRLFEGTQHNVGQIELPKGTPVSMDEFLQLDDPQSQLHFHTGTSQGGLRDGVYHGHGFTDKEKKVLIEQYINRVEGSMSKFLQDHPAPLVLAGVDYLMPMYRKSSDYWNIMPGGIIGNPEHLDAGALQEKAWPLVEPYFREEIENAIAKFKQDAITQKATDMLQDILIAAQGGRIDRLLLATGAQVWGNFDPATGEVSNDLQGKQDQNDIELIDLAAVNTLQTGGTVYTLAQQDMPTNSPIAAIFRY
jgi:hypothetical protein